MQIMLPAYLGKLAAACSSSGTLHSHNYHLSSGLGHRPQLHTSGFSGAVVMCSSWIPLFHYEANEAVRKRHAMVSTEASSSRIIQSSGDLRPSLETYIARRAVPMCHSNTSWRQKVQTSYSTNML